MRRSWAAVAAIVGLLVAGEAPATAQEASSGPSTSSASPGSPASPTPSASPAESTAPVVQLARFDDPVGDQEGGVGPDIVGVTVSQPDEGSLSFSIAFAEDAPLTYDLETWSTDMLAVIMDTHSNAFVELPDGGMPAHYFIGVHGATLPDEVETGAPMWRATDGDGELLWNVVDVAVEGTTITLTVDLELLGDPERLYFQVGAGTEGQEETSGSDGCPDEQPGEIVLAPG